MELSLGDILLDRYLEEAEKKRAMQWLPGSQLTREGHEEVSS